MSSKLALLVCAAGLAFAAPAMAQYRDGDRADHARRDSGGQRPAAQPSGAPPRSPPGPPAAAAPPASRNHIEGRAWQAPSAPPQGSPAPTAQPAPSGAPGRPSSARSDWSRSDRYGGDRGGGSWDRSDRDRGGGGDRGWSYRGEDHSRFHVAPYRYPYNWGYRTWRVGERLPYLFLSDSYYIDFGLYGLPRPPYGYHWVRFGPDVLLVNIYTGEIVDVVYDIFY